MQQGYNNKIRERRYEQLEIEKKEKVEGKRNTDQRVKKATGSHDSGY